MLRCVKTQFPAILIDTREQQPLQFGSRILTKSATLKIGDYSLRGHSTSGVVIERKSLNDFFSSFAGKHRTAMAMKMKKMGAYHSAMLLVEADVDEVFNGSRYQVNVSGASLFGSVVGMCTALGIQTIFVGDRAAAAVAAYRFMFDYLKRLHVH